MKDLWKLPEDVAEKIRKEAEEAATRKRNRAEEFDIYSGFVESQKVYFQQDVKKILGILENLIMEGKLYIYTRLTARIKDPESALQNDDISQMKNNLLMGKILEAIDKEDYTLVETTNEKALINKNKALDDVFGITIITDTQKEVETVLEEIKNNFKIGKEKRMNKPNYQAVHLSLWGDDENPNSPIVECQLKTMQNHIDSYDHTLYKTETMLRRKLYEAGIIEKNIKPKLNEKGQEKVEQVIQEYYNNNGFSILTNIPRMWEASFNEGPEVMEIRHLSEAQAIKRVYPSLIIRSDKTR